MLRPSKYTTLLVPKTCFLLYTLTVNNEITCIDKIANDVRHGDDIAIKYCQNELK